MFGVGEDVLTPSPPIQLCQCSVYRRLRLLRWVSICRGGPQGPYFLHPAASGGQHQPWRRRRRGKRPEAEWAARGRRSAAQGAAGPPSAVGSLARCGWAPAPCRVRRGAGSLPTGVAADSPRRPSPPFFSRPRPSGEAHYTSHNAPRPPLLARDRAAEVTRRGPEAPQLWSRESAEPTMAETDPKTVQDLTAVVRPLRPGPPPRGERGVPSGPGAAAERGAGAPRPPWGEARQKGVDASGLAPFAGHGGTSCGSARPSSGDPRLPAVGGAAGLVVLPRPFFSGVSMNRSR